MIRRNPAFQLVSGLCLFLALSALQACATVPQERLEDLETITRAYNNFFESRHPDGGVTYVRDDLKSAYLMQYAQVKDRVIFGQSQRINQALYKDDELVPLTEQVLEAEHPPFNKAVITMRYEVATKPSNRVRTVVYDQEWLLQNGRWVLVPNLDPFIK
ncbi:hypothetical protein ACTRW9_05815 [Nitrospina sp. 32_T5]|uniref:hypothetical protein n=1 Tax=unclassified Nitrospina TaxID=2638683 RepID=UPI003F99E01C